MEGQRQQSGAAAAAATPGVPPRRTESRERSGETLKPFSLTTTSNRVDINLHTLQRWGPVATPGDDERATREYGQIKRPILNQAFNRTAPVIPTGNVLVVTSALAGEGKSLTALNLALSMTREKDLSVVLVDGDAAKPDLSRTLMLADARGLSDLLADDGLQFDDVVWKTSVDGLYFVPAGLERGIAPELLGSLRMKHVVDRFVRDLPRTIVVIDTSPLLLTNETPVLVGLAGQVVLVVRANQTLRQVVGEALARLDPAKPVGLVLNGTDSTQASYYGYGGAGGSISAAQRTEPPALDVTTAPQ
jgi:Mrp family chromosome partitioning ATPase